MQHTQSESLKSSFTSILNELSLTSKDDNVMVVERIQGGDLGDFVRFKYPHLTDAQKQEFFRALGQLAMLDLALGNCDRITKPSWLEGTPKFEDESVEPDPSNTGNMMYSENKEGRVFFYPIDNEIEEKSYSGEQSAAYLQFFQSTLEQIEHLNPAEEMSYLTTIIVKSLHRAFQILPNRGELKAFQEDLLKQPWAQASIERGIRTMVCLLKGELMKYWNSDESDALKERLDAMNPDLCQALDVRMRSCFLQNGCKKQPDRAQQFRLV